MFVEMTLNSFVKATNDRSFAHFLKFMVIFTNIVGTPRVVCLSEPKADVP